MTGADLPSVQTVLVTGGSGFLGRAAVRHLLQSGARVRSFQRNSRQRPDVDVRIGDVRDPVAIAEALRGVDVVIHAAGLAHVFRHAESAPFADINAGGSEVVARASVSAGVRHFVHVSSVAVYGSSERGAHEAPVTPPPGPYGRSKAEAEERVLAAASGSSMRLTILRLATLYGEEDRGNVQRLLRLIDSGRFRWIGAGENRKSLLHVDDAGRACLRPLAAAGDPVEIYNVSAAPVRMRDVVEGLAVPLGRALPRWYVPTPVASGLSAALSVVAPALGRPLATWLNDDVYPAGRFEERFRFSTQVSLAEGLARQVAWWRAQPGAGCR